MSKKTEYVLQGTSGYSWDDGWYDQGRPFATEADAIEYHRRYYAGLEMRLVKRIIEMWETITRLPALNHPNGGIADVVA